MDALASIFGILLFVGSLYLVGQARRLWRGQPTRLDQQLGDRSSGGALTRAYASLFPLASVLGCAFFGAGVTISLVDADTTAGRILVGILIMASVIGLVLAPVVALFNRPRFVIPPRLRSNPGLIHDVLTRPDP